MTLQTARLILRPWSQDDAPSLYQYASDPRVGSAAGWPAHTSVDESREIIRTVFSSPYTYAIALKNTGEVIGSIGLRIGEESALTHSALEGDLGYWIGVPHWGQGYVPEASAALIHYGFEELHLQTIWGAYFDGNAQSQRVFEKCGFIYDHTNHNIYWPLTDQTLNEHVMKLTHDDWKQHSATTEHC